MAETNQTWWEALNHGGLLIGPKQLASTFPDVPTPLNDWTIEQLRRRLNQFAADGKPALPDLLAVVLEKVAGLDEENGDWRKDPGTEWSRTLVTGESAKPRRVWTHPGGTAFPIFVSEDERLGIGRGVRSVSRVLEWLRKGNERIALLTNGRQWRLIHAGLDHEAWAQWDTEQWFAEGEPGPQVAALQILLSPEALLPKKQGGLSPLLAAIDETRKGQAEVSTELGERVRKAVELLIQAHAAALDEKGGELARKDIYLAAVRMVMRMVVILFAETRDLLPRDNALYFGSYGLQGLRETLRRAAGGRRERLRNRSGAWPRVLALFRLVCEGSPHKALPVPRYGGELFRPGLADGDDGIRRAVHLFENAAFLHEVSDDVVYEMLELITTTHVRVRQGNAAKVTRVPVNFADLSTEYIGMLYEGLLGYELRRVSDDDEAIIFLNLGDQPALPLKRLEAMTDKSLENLVDKFKKKVAAVAVAEDESGDSDEDEEEEGADEATDENADEEVAVVDIAEEAAETEADSRQVIRDRAVNWAKRAVVAGKLVNRPRAKGGNAESDYQLKVGEKAKQITGTAYLPGQYFLIRSSGTRKGSGTFYTRPALAIPTTHRTLRPLAFVAPLGADGEPNELASPQEWTPRRPEDILALKVCDPACGSASFLVATLRFLTDALYVSLHRHGRIQPKGDGALVTLAEGKEGTGVLAEETLPCRPDAEQFEARLKARLKRYVVERCIYGVDHDRLAIELAQMALWIETMDRELPFEFLDHKVKHGNALVGAWFDQFAIYPILAWDREAGDAKHERFVHHKHSRISSRGKSKGQEVTSGDPWNIALMDFYTNTAKPRYRDWLDGNIGLWDQVRPDDARKQHEEAVGLFEQLHGLPVQDSEVRAEFYRERIAGSASYQKLKEAFDTWCAIWFWPPEQLQYAPVATGAVDAQSLKAIVASVARERAFFHWELEFPDVFRTTGAGFDAMLGNPPWEISKPNSKEFFSRIDPLYRSYGKQEALDKQEEYFQRSASDEADWIRYTDFFKAMSNWSSRAASPFGDGSANGDAISFSRLPRENEQYRDVIESRRTKNAGFSDRRHPFRHQGSADLNFYKMFVELSHALTRDGGRFGMIVPSGVYTDKGTSELRRLFLDECRWRWLFGFENARKIFDIHRSYKFNPIIVEKGGTTEAILTAFMHRDVRDWEEGEKYAIPYTREQVERFSPKTKAILEIRDQRDLEILEKIYSNSVLLGDQSENGWGIKYTTEFHMTNDSKLFPPRTRWEERGYKPDELGRWIGPDGDAALPLYEGRMIGQFDFSEKGWVSGKGRTAVWRDIPFSSKTVEPQYLMSDQEFNSHPALKGLKLGFMTIGSATNSRSMIASLIYDRPCGNSIATLSFKEGEALFATAVLNSFVYDYVLRRKLGGLNLNYFVIEETPLPLPKRVPKGVGDHVASLNLTHLQFLPVWSKYLGLATPGPDKKWALTPGERLRRRAIVEALVAYSYGLSVRDFFDLVSDCAYPAEGLRSDEFTRALPPKGFWRVDRDRDPELRLPVISLVAFANLTAIVEKSGDRQAGVATFCGSQGTDGWELPLEIRLADYGWISVQDAEVSKVVRQRFDLEVQ